MADDLWALIESERIALADFLEGHDPDELMTPSLCREDLAGAGADALYARLTT